MQTGVVAVTGRRAVESPVDMAPICNPELLDNGGKRRIAVYHRIVNRRGKRQLIAIMAAVPFETEEIRSHVRFGRRIKLGRSECLRGRLGGTDVVVFHCGVGKANAAHGATLILERFTPDLLLLTGCGGAYRRSRLTPGSLAIASREIFGDDGVIVPDGWKSMQYLNLPLMVKGKVEYYNSFDVDRECLRRARAILRKYRPAVGPFVTVSQVSGTDERADEMERRFRGICENMEGASIAQLCVRYEISFLEIRGISNIVKERNRKEWDLASAVRVSQTAALEIVTSWKER